LIHSRYGIDIDYRAYLPGHVSEYHCPWLRKKRRYFCKGSFPNGISQYRLRQWKLFMLGSHQK